MNANTNSKVICKDITKHPEYQKVLTIKDKKVQQQMIECLKNKYKNGFDLRQFTQKFDKPNHTYVITKYETHTKKDASEQTFNILYDKDGFKYFSKAKIDKFIEENNVPNEITEGSMFTISTSDKSFFIKDNEVIFYYPIECVYIEGTKEVPLLEDTEN